MTKCPPKYKNLDEIQAFSEQRYATVQWAEQNCQNDEYLKQEVDELKYGSPARIRKRWKPILVDDNNSYGYTVNPNKVVTFSQLSRYNFTIDFTDFSMIDTIRSDCDFLTFIDNDNVRHMCATIPKVQTETEINSCKNMEPSDGINSFWYCGFDKDKNYHVRPDWIKDVFDSEIPAVCRAQTITIPSDVPDGSILKSVDLRLENNGTLTSNWGSPLFVQLWPTQQVKIEKTKWAWNSKWEEPYNPPQYEYIAFPRGTPKTALATAVYEPTRITPNLQSFVFDKKIEVNKNEQYAIVMLSPLSHWEHCPRIGGWGRNCYVDKYAGGDAFLSENNGQSWQRYGKTDFTNQYRMGRYTPLDFGFIAHISKYTAGYAKDENFYLYLKPIHLNPVKALQLVPVGYGDEVQEANLTLEFQVSKTGKANSWVTLQSNDLSIRFNRDPATGEYPHFAYIRVKMSTNNKDYAPYLDSLKVIVDMDRPKEMYVRTMKYNPKITPMLGASAWSKFYSNFETDPKVTGSCELISEKVGIEHFDIITANELPRYTYIPGLNVQKLTDEDISARYAYLMDDANALNILKKYKVYVKPYSYTSGGQTITHPMSFSDGIQFDNSPAYPIIEGNINPFGNANEIPITEWIDYKFDYDNDKLIFNEVMNQYTSGNTVITQGIAEYLPSGTLEIVYHPIFIQDLTKEDVGIRADENSEGFVLDYFKEEFIINESDVENRYIPLKFPPCDPIRELVIDDEEYFEDIHFTVDYLNKRIEFPIIDVDHSATLLTENIGKNMHVVYTPSIDDTGLIIAYRGIRENTDKQMRIYDNYIEYKV